MKASELIDHVAEAAEIEKAQAKRAVEAVFAGITDAAKAGNEVEPAQLWQVQGQGQPRPPGPQPGDRNDDRDCRFPQADLCPGQAGQGRPRRLRLAARP